MFDVFNIPEFIYSYGYIGIFIIVFLESSIFPPLPGDSLLFTAGLFASTAGFNIFILIISIFIATFLGGIMGYHVGIHLVKLHKYAFFRKLLKQENIDKAHAFFVQYGRLSVTFARFIPFMRTFVPIVAGVANMNYKIFIKYNLIGATLWSTTVTLLGYFLGRTFPVVKDYLWVVVVLIIIVSLVPVALQFAHHHIKKRRAK